MRAATLPGWTLATPGAPGYAMEVFAQLHYGVTPSLAAQSLLLLAAVAGVAAALGLAWGQGAEG